MGVTFSAKGLLALVAVCAAIVLGVVLRAVDPASSPVIAAEDPYTHMGLVRQHLREGSLEPLSATGSLYPPGLHAWVATAWAFTGSDLYGLVQYLPVLLGAVGILGIFFLVSRGEGMVGGFVAALAVAVTPELIFRSTMLSPTALDLAVLPFFLLALLETARGRLAWAVAAAPVAVFLAFSHPWVFGILAPACAVFWLLAYVMPWSPARCAPLAPANIAAALAVVGGGFGLSMTGCGGYCGPGFRDLLGIPGGAAGVVAGLAVIGLAFLPMALVRWAPRAARFLAPSPDRPAMRNVTRASLTVFLLIVLAVVLLPAIASGLPDEVDLPRMFGWPTLLLAAAGYLALPWVASRVAHMGAAMAAVTLPFVVYNPLASQFLPHRTAVFLGLGLVVLAGVAAAAAVRLAVDLARRWLPTHDTPHAKRPHLAVALVPALVMASVLGGAVYAGTPDAYPGGWYRLYPACDLEGLQAVADWADAHPDAVVVAGSWEAKLVLAGLADDASRLWIKPGFFTSQDVRDDLTAVFAAQGRPLAVVTDRHLASEAVGAETQFLASAPWIPLGSWCAGQGLEAMRLHAYVLDPAASGAAPA